MKFIKEMFAFKDFEDFWIVQIDDISVLQNWHIE